MMNNSKHTAANYRVNGWSQAMDAKVSADKGVSGNRRSASDNNLVADTGRGNAS